MTENSSQKFLGWQFLRLVKQNLKKIFLINKRALKFGLKRIYFFLNKHEKLKKLCLFIIKKIKLYQVMQWLFPRSVSLSSKSLASSLVLKDSLRETVLPTQLSQLSQSAQVIYNALNDALSEQKKRGY